MYHMQISTHPEEPLHFLWTSRPTMLHLCGHLLARKKNAMWLRILLRSILGYKGGMETRGGLYFQFPQYCQCIIWGFLKQDFFGVAEARTHKSAFLLILSEPWGETLSVRSFGGEKDCVFIKFKLSSQRVMENVLASCCLSTPEIKPLLAFSLMLASVHRVCGLGAGVGAIV